MSEKLSPTEILEKFPALKTIWTVNDLGTFLRAGLLVGTYDHTKRISLIEPNSVITLSKFYNQVRENQKIQT